MTSQAHQAHQAHQAQPAQNTLRIKPTLTFNKDDPKELQAWEKILSSPNMAQVVKEAVLHYFSGELTPLQQLEVERLLYARVELGESYINQAIALGIEVDKKLKEKFGRVIVEAVQMTEAVRVSQTLNLTP